MKIDQFVVRAGGGWAGDLVNKNGVFFPEVDVDSLNDLGARSLGGRNAAKLPLSISGLPQMAWEVSQ